MFTLGKNIVASNVETLASFFPEELKGAVKGFDHEIRQAIVAALLIKGDLSFAQLAGILGISKGLLSHHLDILLDSAIVRNYSPSEFRGRFDSYYAISSIGEALLESLTRTFVLADRRVSLSNRSSLAALDRQPQARQQQTGVSGAGLQPYAPLPIAQAQTTSSTGS